MNRTRLIAVLLGLALVAVALWRAPYHRGMGEPVTQTRFMMGTSVTIKVFARSLGQARRLMDRAFGEIARVEALTSASAQWDSTSQVRAINAVAGSLWVPVGSDLAEILDTAVAFSRDTGGKFDVTIGPLSQLWGFSSGRLAIPSPEQISQSLRLVDYRAIRLKDGMARLERKGMALDLGGVAKGYAVDRAVALLGRGGARAALVEAGGDVAYFGRKPGGQPWKVAVQHPRSPESLIEVDCPYPSVATSGDYQRAMVVQGKRYHHILDPSKGYPARGAVGVTVWTTSAMRADILATAAFVMGAQEGIAFVERCPDTEALVFWEEDGQLKHITSAGLTGKVRTPLPETEALAAY